MSDESPPRRNESDTSLPDLSMYEDRTFETCLNRRTMFSPMRIKPMRKVQETSRLSPMLERFRIEVSNKFQVSVPSDQFYSLLSEPTDLFARFEHITLTSDLTGTLADRKARRAARTVKMRGVTVNGELLILNQEEMKQAVKFESRKSSPSESI